MAPHLLNELLPRLSHPCVYVGRAFHDIFVLFQRKLALAHRLGVQLLLVDLVNTLNVGVLGGSTHSFAVESSMRY